jgi:hypothetical protein
LNIDNAMSSAFSHVIAFLIGAAMVENAENSTSANMKKAFDVLTNDVLGAWREVSPQSDFGGAI